MVCKRISCRCKWMSVRNSSWL